MAARDIEVANLSLDEENPRHDPASGERELIAAMFEGLGASRTVKLAEHIVANGMSPTDNMLVISNGDGTYTSVEGNRRLTVLKLLADPSLAPSKKVQATFERLKAELSAPITLVSAAEMKDREEARPWILLRHDGPADGASVVDWDAVQKQRFTGKAGEVQLALLVMGSLKATYPSDTKLIADLEKIEKRNPTTLGRLPKDGGVRTLLGLNKGDPLTSSRLTPDELAELWAKVASDLAAGKKTVSDLKKSKQMTDYVKTLLPAHLVPVAAAPSTPATPSPVPTADTLAQLPDASGQTAAGTAAPPSPSGGDGVSSLPRTPTEPGSEPVAPPVLPAPPKPKLPSLFAGVQLAKLDHRVQAVLRETYEIDVDGHPNTAAVMVRVVVELAVDDLFDKKGWAKTIPTPKGEKEIPLANKITKILDELNPGGKDPRFQPVRSELTVKNGMFSVTTLNAFVHNPYFSPDPRHVRKMALHFTPFLAAFDSLVP